METVVYNQEAATPIDSPDSTGATDMDEQSPLVLHLRPALDLTDDQFFVLCQSNELLRIESTAEGDLEIMPPTGGTTGDRNAELTMQTRLWAKQDGTGKVFDSSTSFILPNGAKRSPDVSWVRNERWQQLTERQQEQFPPLCPDFVIELRSPTDRLTTLQRKLAEYIAQGAQLGWLIDPQSRSVYVYRSQTTVEHLENPETLSGEGVLSGFVLNLREVW